MSTLDPTPHAQVNAILGEMLPRVQGVLGDNFVGMYLDGSLALGDFDEASDIDFVFVTDKEVSPSYFLALRRMHDEIAKLGSPYAVQLEGSYLSRAALWRHDAQNEVHPNIERGTEERLKLVAHDQTWTVHRYVLREHGIILTGPEPRTLVDAVTPDNLRRAMQETLQSEWLEEILAHPTTLRSWGYQSYVVLTLCRVLYTREHGTVVSKHAAARWAQRALDKQWAPLIERAWKGRRNPELRSPPEDVQATRELIRYAQQLGTK